MKELNPPFRLYDFLAYLFPGAATLHAAYIIMKSKGPQIVQSLSTHSSVIDVTLAIVAAYALGLVWSVVSREGLRRLIWLFENPRIQYFKGDSPKQSSLGSSLTKKLQAQARKQFDEPSLEAEQAHRLCRAYVVQHCPTLWERRQSIVAVRAMCANFIGPALLYTVVFAVRSLWPLAVIAGIASIALVAKTVTLDQREWREIYLAFLVHQSTNPFSTINYAEKGENE